MIPIIIYEKGTEVPDYNCYLVTRDGVYLKKNTGLIKAMVKVEKISCLEKIIPYANLDLPPIPFELFVQIRLFFKAVFELHRSEAIVLFYFDEVRKEYFLSVPYQLVSPASLDYKVQTKNNDWKLVGSIHSHADFEAFHSSVDVRDEANFDGLHITMGNVDQDSFSLSVETVVNNNRFSQVPEKWIIGLVKEEKLEKPREINKKDDHTFFVNQELFNQSFFRKVIVYNFLLPIDSLSFPKEWLDLVHRERRPQHFNYQENPYFKRVRDNEKD